MILKHQEHVERVAALHEKYPERIENFLKIGKLSALVGVLLVTVASIGTFFLSESKTAMIILTVLAMAGFSSAAFGLKEIFIINKAKNHNNNNNKV